MKCKICGKRFKLTKDRLYHVPKLFGQCIECTDCPRCGCQIMLNIREGTPRKENADHDKS